MTLPFTPLPWPVLAADQGTVDALAQATGLSGVTARILVARGVTSRADADRLLSPTLEGEWLDPEEIPGMTSAADAVAEVVRAGRHIVVFGDFDLDGVSSAAVAARGLAAMGAQVSAVVPHRFREGYGLSAAAIERVMKLKPHLVLTVDCGISSGPEARLLAEKGVALVVTDHHVPGDGVPAGVPIADPKLEPNGSASEDLAGAGVALKLVHAVGNRLGHPTLWRGLTDLATLGTIADIVPLTRENRAIVADGVARMRVRPRTCIAALASVADVSIDAMNSQGVAFGLVPRLNAPGRMADPQLAIDLLLCDEPAKCQSLARGLDELNRARQAAEADLAEAALALAERTYAGERALVLAGEGWHEGVKGIVASRLASRFGVPCILLAIEDGIATGSGRSVGTVDLYRAVEACREHLDRFGGHAAAVGCALPAERVEAFRRCLLTYLDRIPPEQFESSRPVEAVIELEDVSAELGAELSQLEPFGSGNPVPLLASGGVFMNDRQKVGRQSTHLRFTAFDGAVSVPAIAFRCRDIDALAGHETAVDLAYEVSVDVWRGRTRVQMKVSDIAPHAASAEAPARELVEDLFERADAILAREEYAGIEEASAFHTKLAGVTFEDRQAVLERLVPGSPLRLARQPENPHDTNACALFDPHGDQVGFFNRRLAAALAPSIDAGVGYDVEVTDVTGGEDGRALGVNVLVSRRDAGAAEQRLAALAAERRQELAALGADSLDRELTRRFIGDGALHDAQAQALECLKRGRSTLVVMATGRGKSLIFHLHAARLALKEGRASVFVYPLRALVADQAFHLEESFAGVGLAVRTITGESSPTERDESFRAVRDGELDVVLTTPEFLHLHAERFANAGRFGFVVVDEAHHVGRARAGHRPAYARLGEAVEVLGGPTVLAVTATADDATAQVIRSTLGVEELVLDPTVRENLVIEDQRDLSDKDAYVAGIVAKGEKTIVYVNSRDQSVRLARTLRKRIPRLAMATAFYNGGLSRPVRNAVEQAFRVGDIRLVVATSAFGEGVNIPDIRNVVLYHLPFNDVEFNQMSGRAGRDSALARIHLLFGGRDARINEMVLSSLAPSRDEMAALYVVLRDIASAEGAGFEITNAELVERSRRHMKSFSLDERGISSALGILKDLGFVVGEGHGPYRRLTFTPGEQKVDLESSVRYAEGQEEIADFRDFKAWALAAEPDELLARFNCPILPSV